MVRLPVLLVALVLAASGQTRIERLTSIVQQDPRNIANILKLAPLIRKLQRISGLCAATADGASWELEDGVRG